MVTYVAKAAPLPPKPKKSTAASSSAYPAELEQMMAGQNRMLLEGLTNVMSQAMAPVIQGQQAISQNLMALNAQMPVAPMLGGPTQEIESSDEEMVAAAKHGRLPSMGGLAASSSEQFGFLWGSIESFTMQGRGTKQLVRRSK